MGEAAAPTADVAPGKTPDDFEEFASVIAPRLFRSALLLCGDWHLAEDLVQTALAKVYVAWRKVRSADRPEAYAHATLTKTFVSHKRVRRNTETPSARVAVETGQGHDVDAHVDLFSALATLDKVDRAVVVLRYWEDRSVADTARHLGMSEGAVRTRATRALPKLRAALTCAEESE
jgi:RNA polymerase sigma-70 factor (sigma-E family)